MIRCILKEHVLLTTQLNLSGQTAQGTIKMWSLNAGDLFGGS